MKRAQIRQLRPGEEVPPGNPKRYKTGHGYIRLRWLVGTQKYVETYEHRVRDGVVVRDEQVHHINKVRHDNRPENLEYLSEAEHQELHKQEIRGKGKWHPFRCEDAALKAAYAENNRRDRQRRREFMLDLYRSGQSTTQIGEEVGLDASNVSRQLRRAGGVMRHRKQTGPTSNTRKIVHARSQMECERCCRSLMWEPSELHHRMPRGIGGSSNPAINLPSNLLHLCRECHAWIESNRDEARSMGFLVPFGWRPANVAVRRKGANVFLSDSGGIESPPKEAD